MALSPQPPSADAAALSSVQTELSGTDAPDMWGEAARHLAVARSRTVPAYSQATWGLGVHALNQALRHEGRDDGEHWQADTDAPTRARLHVVPADEDVRVTLTLERAILGSQIWALPILFWPFAFLLALLVARGELPWAFWVVPALFALAPAFLLGLRRAGHRAWTALALRRARRALDAFADAVAVGNRLEAPPAGRLFAAGDASQPAHLVDEDAWDDAVWDAPFVAPDVEELASLAAWFSPDEAAALDAAQDGGIELRATAPLAGDGAARPLPASTVSGVPAPRTAVRLLVSESGRAPQSWRVRRRRGTSPTAAPPAGWMQHTLVSGFGEWLPERSRRDASAPRR